MSLPIAEDEQEEDDEVEDDNDRVEQAVSTRARPPKTAPLASKLLVVHGGEEECYWCGRAFSKDKMKRITMAGLPAYKCERC